MGNQIDTKGIGNGISLMIFAGIVARWSSIYTATTNILARARTVSRSSTSCCPCWSFWLWSRWSLSRSDERRAPIPVQYAKRVMGRKMYGGQSTFLPIKVNMSGVLPIIFAQSIATLPATIVAFTGTGSSSFWTWMNTYIFDTKSAFYIVCYFLLIIAFSYFYATIQFNPIEIANNLKKNGGFIPGFRPGKRLPTSS